MNGWRPGLRRLPPPSLRFVSGKYFWDKFWFFFYCCQSCHLPSLRFVSGKFPLKVNLCGSSPRPALEKNLLEPFSSPLSSFAHFSVFFGPWNWGAQTTPTCVHMSLLAPSWNKKQTMQMKFKANLICEGSNHPWHYVFTTAKTQCNNYYMTERTHVQGSRTLVP